MIKIPPFNFIFQPISTLPPKKQHPLVKIPKVQQNYYRIVL